MKLQIEIVNRYNNESATVRLIVIDKGQVTDIIEGPTRFVITRALKLISPDTKLELRKVR